MKALHPPRIVCRGEQVCVPLDGCPDGFIATLNVIAGPMNTTPPQIVAQVSTHVVIEATELGAWNLEIECCPP